MKPLDDIVRAIENLKKELVDRAKSMGFELEDEDDNSIAFGTPSGRVWLFGDGDDRESINLDHVDFIKWLKNIAPEEVPECWGTYDIIYADYPILEFMEFYRKYEKYFNLMCADLINKD